MIESGPRCSGFRSHPPSGATSDRLPVASVRVGSCTSRSEPPWFTSCIAVVRVLPFATSPKSTTADGSTESCGPERLVASTWSIAGATAS